MLNYHVISNSKCSCYLSGLDSQFAIIETVLTGILDFSPKWRPKKTMIVGIVCTVGFICGLPLTTPVGINILR